VIQDSTVLRVLRVLERSHVLQGATAIFMELILQTLALCAHLESIARLELQIQLNALVATIALATLDTQNRAQLVHMETEQVLQPLKDVRIALQANTAMGWEKFIQPVLAMQVTIASKELTHLNLQDFRQEVFVLVVDTALWVRRHQNLVFRGPSTTSPVENRLMTVFHAQPDTTVLVQIIPHQQVHVKRDTFVMAVRQ